MNGEPAAVSFISPTQVNFLVPPDIQSGAAQIVVTNNGLASTAATVTITSTAPAFFTLGAADATTGNSYIAAEHANGGIAGPPSLVTGVTSTPFNAGETMVLYGTGLLAATNPAGGGWDNADRGGIATDTAADGGQRWEEFTRQ